MGIAPLENNKHNQLMEKKKWVEVIFDRARSFNSYMEHHYFTCTASDAKWRENVDQKVLLIEDRSLRTLAKGKPRSPCKWFFNIRNEHAESKKH